MGTYDLKQNIEEDPSSPKMKIFSVSYNLFVFSVFYY